MKIHFTRRFLFFSSLTLLWMIVIFLFSAQNGEESSQTSARILAVLCELFRFSPSADMASLLMLMIRKAAHMTEFGILALLWLETLRTEFGKAKWNFPAAFAAASLYAATDELHQLFVSDRAGQFTDWLIDSAGALLLLLSAWGVSKCLRREKNR